MILFRSDNTKHLLTTALAGLICAAIPCNAAAAAAGFRNESTLVSNAKTAYQGKYTNVQWQTEKSDGIGCPVAYGESVLLPSGNKVLRLNEQDGFQLAAVTLPEEVCTQYSGVMNGDTLIQPTESGLCTIDFTSGEVTAHKIFGGEVDSDVCAIDGAAFFSAKNNDSETFYCVDTSDMSVQWEYTSAADITSPTIQGDYVIFGAGGDLVTCNTTSGEACEIPVGSEILSAPLATEYAVFFPTDSGMAKLRLNKDGTMEEDTLIFCDTGANSSAAVVYDSKLYTVSDSGFHILDSLNMEITHSFPEITGGTAPLITLGMGTRIYTVGRYEDAWALYTVFDPAMAEDSDKKYEPSFTALAGLEDFSGGRMCVSEAGTMYLRDAYGRLFATTRVEYDIVGIVIKLLILVALLAGVFVWIRMVGKRRSDIYPKY